MSIKSRKFQKGIRTKPTTDAATLEGEQRTDSADNKQKIFLDSAERAVVTEDQSQDLSNKSIDADNNTISNLETDNLKAGVLNTDLSGAATDTEIPSALAVKTALEGQNEASEINYDNSTSGLTATEVQAAIDEVEGRLDTSETALSDHLVDAVDAHDASAISNAPTGNLVATDVQGALDELQTEIDALPAKSETLQNKTLDSSNTISGSIETPTRLDVKQDTEANLITYAATASDGQLCFATDTLKMYQVITNELQPVGGGGSTSFEITQAAHGLTVGSGIFHNGTIYVDAQANSDATLAYHVVVEVIDVNTFVAADFGRIEVASHGFTVGEYYFQSEATAGLPTITQPVSGYSNPLFYVETADILQIKCLRPSPVGDTINLDELADVSVPAPTDGQALIYNLANLRWEATDVAGTAADITYSNATSGLTATNTQAAIDEVDSNVDTNATNIATNVSNITSNDVDIRNLERNVKINYITNPDLNDDVANITGDTNLVISQETVAPLRGTGSLKIAKGTIDASTQSVLIDMNPVDAADLAQMMTISFDIDASNVNYNDGDAQVRIIKDPAGSPTTIRVNGEDIKGGKYTHIAQFQTDHTEVDYALEIYWVDTGVLASELILDNIQVGPREVAKGAAMTDWVAFTPTGSFVTNTVYEGYTKRVGDSIDIQYKLRFTGIPNTTSFVLDLPSGLIVDHSKLIDDNGAGLFNKRVYVGEGAIMDTVGSRYPVYLNYDKDSGKFDVRAGNASSTYLTDGTTTQAAPISLNIGDTATIIVRDLPIQGWSSNTIMSEDLGGREIVAVYGSTSATSVGSSETVLDFATKSKDTTASVTTGATWKFTVPETGSYSVSGNTQVAQAGFNGTTERLFIKAYVDGSLYNPVASSNAGILVGMTPNTGTQSVYIPFTATLDLVKGQELDIRANQSSGGNINFNASGTIHIQKLASPQTILATETVAARASCNNNQPISNNSQTTIIFNNTEFDTHGTYNNTTGIFTAPNSGYYQVNGKAGTSIPGANASFVLYLYVNLTAMSETWETTDTVTNNRTVLMNELVYLNKGDEVRLDVFHNTGATRTLQVANTKFSIARLK